MSKFSYKQIVFLSLSIIGLILPLFFISQFFGELGRLDWGKFISSTLVNPASSTMMVNLFIVLVAFIFWMIPEAKELGMQNWWIYLFLSIFVSAAFGIPIFLFMREKHLESIKR